jgi:hypothetical protein
MPKKTKAIKITDAKKAWNRRQQDGRQFAINQKAIERSFLIICEGVNTEPIYFKSFPIGNAEVESYGLGSSKTALVSQVIHLLNADKELKNKEVWVVFDFDIKPDQLEQQKQDYNNAVELAGKHKIHVACSNDAFELWFLLHYQHMDMQVTRHQYYEKLSQLWNCNYEKIGKTLDYSRKIYQRLQQDANANQDSALKRAEQLHEQHKNLLLADKNPHTTVFQLVKALNEYL